MAGQFQEGVVYEGESLDTRVTKLVSRVEQQEAKIDEVSNNYKQLQSFLRSLVEEPQQGSVLQMGTPPFGLPLYVGHVEPLWTILVPSSGSKQEQMRSQQESLHVSVPYETLTPLPLCEASDPVREESLIKAQAAIEPRLIPIARRNLFRDLVIATSAGFAVLAGLVGGYSVIANLYFLTGPAALTALASVLILGINLFSPDTDEHA